MHGFDAERKAGQATVFLSSFSYREADLVKAGLDGDVFRAGDFWVNVAAIGIDLCLDVRVIDSVMLAKRLEPLFFLGASQVFIDRE
jgi:hypothetical protein